MEINWQSCWFIFVLLQWYLNSEEISNWSLLLNLPYISVTAQNLFQSSRRQPKPHQKLIPIWLGIIHFPPIGLLSRTCIESAWNKDFFSSKHMPIFYDCIWSSRAPRRSCLQQVQGSNILGSCSPFLSFNPLGWGCTFIKWPKPKRRSWHFSLVDVDQSYSDKGAARHLLLIIFEWFKQRHLQFTFCL